MRVHLSHRSRPRVSFGCLGSAIVAVGYLVVGALIITALVIGAAVLAVILLAVLAVAGVDRVLLASSSRWRARRALYGPLIGTRPVIDASAEAISKTMRRR
jgi:uncharacterized membrane protein (Fun14 family)